MLTTNVSTIPLNLSPQSKDSRDYRFLSNLSLLQTKHFIILHPFSSATNLRVIYEGLKVPRAVSWRPLFRYVFHQGSLGSCTANATGYLMSFIQRTPSTMYSRLFLYYNTRKLHNTISSDSGATLRNTLRALFSEGMPLEKVWSYVPSQFRVKPPVRAYQQALRIRGFVYVSVPISIDVWEEMIRLGRMIVFGTFVFQSWFDSRYQTQRTGRVPLPLRNDRYLGGHALLCTGYDQDRQEFQFVNSWGATWGSQGFGTLPYEYLRRKYTFDAWVILPL